jgi:hypothetical protein
MLNYQRDIEPNKLFNQASFLKTAIGKRLTEIERFFSMEPKDFWNYHNELSNQKYLYFSLNPGATQFWFDNTSHYAFRYYSANAPIILFPGIYPKDVLSKYKLSQIDEELASSKLKNCLGEYCKDVRIWNFSETEREIRIEKAEGYWNKDLEKEYQEKEDEVIASGVSYLLSNGEEIIYCCNFYDDTLSDSLLLIKDIQQKYVHSCFSLGEGEYIIQSMSRFASHSN